MPAATKAKPKTATKPLPPCKIIYFADHGRRKQGSDDTTCFRRTIKGTWGDYVLAVPHGSPLVLIGECEIAAFAKDLAAGSAKELEIVPGQIDTVVRELADKAIASEFEALRTAADELLSVSQELAQVKAQLASARQQLASFLNPHADAPLPAAS